MWWFGQSKHFVRLGRLSYGEFPRFDDHRNLLLYHGGATILRGGSEIHVRTVDVFFAGEAERSDDESIPELGEIH